MKFLKSWSKIFPIMRRSNTFFTTSSTTSIATKIVQEDGIRSITLSNPKLRNTLSLSTINELIGHLTTNKEDTDLRVIVIKADGPVFSSGHNLKEFELSRGGAPEVRQVFSACSQLMLEVVRSPVPVVAVVDGLAAAAGCQLVAQCDVALCTPRSTFSTPGASFGVFCSTPGIAVARTVSRKAALKMLLTGLPITAEEAQLCGLVTQVVPAESLEEELNKIIDAIKSKSRAVITLGKKFFYEQIEKDLPTAYSLGEEVMVNNILLKDGQEGVKSFIEKRRPSWHHK